MDKSEIRLSPLSLDDLEGIISVKGRVLHNPFFDPRLEKEIYGWSLQKNPFRNDNYPLGYTLKQGGSIVGCVVLVPAAIKIGDGVVYACFEEDLMVLPEFRFHGLKLLNAVWKTSLMPFVIATTPNKLSFELEKSLGARTVSFTRARYVKLLDPINIARKKLPIFKIIFKSFESITEWLLYQPLVLFSNLYLTVMQRLRYGLFSGEKITTFDKRFDDLYERISKDYKVSIVRNSAYLNWRYVECPLGEREIYAISDGGGELCGYIVLQKERLENGIMVANILDIFTSRRNVPAIFSLLKYAESYARQNGLETISLIGTFSGIAKVAYAAGFVRNKLRIPTCIFINKDVTTREVSNDTRNWYLSSGDGDTAIYSTS